MRKITGTHVIWNGHIGPIVLLYITRLFQVLLDG